MTAGRRMRTRAYQLGLHDTEGGGGGYNCGEGLLLDGLPRPTRRRRITSPSPNDDESGSCASGHTTDDGSIASSSASPAAPASSGSACASPVPAETEQQQVPPPSLALAKEWPASAVGQRCKQRGKVALVLGMIRMSNAFMETYIGPADPLLDLHSAHDTRWIRRLEKELQMDLALNGRKIGVIAGDYIRFPCDYLRKCYIHVVNVLLPTLLRSGLLATDCKVHLPYSRRQAGVRNIYQEIEDAFKPGRPGAPQLVRPAHNPLYRATRKLFKEEHMHKTEDLDTDTPFLHFVLGSSTLCWATPLRPAGRCGSHGGE